MRELLSNSNVANSLKTNVLDGFHERSLFVVSAKRSACHGVSTSHDKANACHDGLRKGSGEDEGDERRVSGEGKQDGGHVFNKESLFLFWGPRCSHSEVLE